MLLKRLLYSKFQNIKIQVSTGKLYRVMGIGWGWLFLLFYNHMRCFEAVELQIVVSKWSISNL